MTTPIAAHLSFAARVSRSAATPLGLLSALALAACALPPAPRQEPSPADAQPSSPTISTDRPSFSDGTGLVPHGHFQLETGYTFTRRSDGGVETERHGAPEVLARYRLLDNLEARLLWGGYLFQETDTGGMDDDDDGASDLALGIKVPIADQDGLLPTLAVGMNLQLGTGADAFSTRHHALPASKLLWSYAFENGLGLGGNLVLAFPHENGDRFSQTAASIYGTWAPRDGTTLFGEYYLLEPYAKDTQEAHNADFGVVHLLSSRVQIDARVGFGLNDAADDFFTGAGISFLF
jgi:hypothetical protein